MDEKKWMGSDLIFDIDANEIPECIEKKGVIQIKFCSKCGYTTEEQDIKVCPNCGAELSRFDHVDTECINIAKDHAIKLIDVLEEDLGFTSITAAFSGHRGFHIFVELDDEYKFMSSDDRREIVSYIRLDEQQIRYLVDQFTMSSKKLALLPPRVADGGIRRRIALALAKYVDNDTKAYILGLKPALNFSEAQKACKALAEHINDITKAVSIAIDAKVTIDITHLVRAPNSINGKTGWRVAHVKNLDFSDFEFTLEELSASDSKIKIKFLVGIPSINVIDTKFHFSRGDEVVLDYPYASYFIFKEVASIVSIVR